ncbi:MAG: protein TolQ [Deltaproteobacteria bacterium]|nr:protein TolQ [Deltaproteobacteria bacterium]MBI3294873.1 protein TolQ [Deltaproteobacteria bacterium]
MLNASGVVQLVLFLLISFSVLTWAIILFKWRTLSKCTGSSEAFLETFWSGKSMDGIYTEAKRHPHATVARVYQAGYLELQRLMDKERQKSGKTDTGWVVTPHSSMENLERALQRTCRNEYLRLERSLPFLATTGSTAPFIGLFGTVWGIMNAFQNIGAQGGASLATVAPGIAEALIATAVGLVCAIPAVMGYNFYIHRVRGLRSQMENFAADFLNIVKRNFVSA